MEVIGSRRSGDGGQGQVSGESVSPDVSSPTAPRRKWTLTQNAFDKLLASLGDDREAASGKYLELRNNLMRFFEWRGCPYPEDHADETINRIARKIDEGEEIRNLSGYCIGVARLLLLEINKDQLKEQRALSEMATSQVYEAEASESDEQLDCLRSCLQNLSPENRELIVGYYQGEKGEKIESRKRLTERFKVSVNTLRMRALRLRERLQVCLQDCVKNGAPAM